MILQLQSYKGTYGKRSCDRLFDLLVRWYLIRNFRTQHFFWDFGGSTAISYSTHLGADEKMQIFQVHGLLFFNLVDQSISLLVRILINFIFGYPHDVVCMLGEPRNYSQMKEGDLS
jgi:hypothetical protein